MGRGSKPRLVALRDVVTLGAEEAMWGAFKDPGKYTVFVPEEEIFDETPPECKTCVLAAGGDPGGDAWRECVCEMVALWGKKRVPCLNGC